MTRNKTNDRSRHYKTSSGTLEKPRPATDIADELIGSDRGGWFELYQSTASVVQQGEMPPALGALSALWLIANGVIRHNQTLSFPPSVPVPPGMRPVGVAPPPDPSDPTPDPFQGRSGDELIPIPWWIVVQLATVWGLVVQARESNEKIDFNKLMEAQGTGSGNRGWVSGSATSTLRKKMVVSVQDLRRREPSLSLNKAIELVAVAYGRDATQVWEAWRVWGSKIKLPEARAAGASEKE